MAVTKHLFNFSFNGNVTNDAGNIGFATSGSCSKLLLTAALTRLNAAVALNGTQRQSLMPNIPEMLKNGNDRKVLSAFGMTENQFMEQLLPIKLLV